MADNRTSVIRFKIQDHLKKALCDLADEECCQLQEMILKCLLDGLTLRIVKRSHLQDEKKFERMQGNSG